MVPCVAHGASREPGFRLSFFFFFLGGGPTKTHESQDDRKAQNQSFAPADIAILTINIIAIITINRIAIITISRIAIITINRIAIITISRIAIITINRIAILTISIIAIITIQNQSFALANRGPKGLGEHKPGRIKPGRIKRAALSLQNRNYNIFCFLIRPRLYASERPTRFRYLSARRLKS